MALKKDIVFVSDNKLYWVDHASETIEVADLDGSNRQKVTQLSNEADPFAVTLWGDYLYWSDW